MSVSAKLNDASILRKFELSKKEETLKNRLFTKKGSSKQATPSKNAQQTVKRGLENTDPNLPQHTAAYSTYISAIQPTDQQVEKFLNNMEGEFRELNKKQVTMGLINTQHQILRDHTEILNDNQKNIAHMLTLKLKEQEKASKNGSSQSVDAQRELIKELIAPINTQIADIRKLYEETRKNAEIVAKEVATVKHVQDVNQFPSGEEIEHNLQSKMQSYQNSNLHLREKAMSAQGRLSDLLPENLQAIKQISNINIQAYSDCINSLKKQLEHLQKDADKAEKELEQRYQKLNALPKPASKLKPTDPFYHVVENGPEGSADIVKTLQNIDFEASRRTVIAKLGGEFDYENFLDEAHSLANGVRDAEIELQAALAQYAVVIPSDMGFSEEDKHAIDLGAQMPSVIDEIKARYRIPKKMPMPHPQQYAEHFEGARYQQQHASEPYHEVETSFSQDMRAAQPLFGVKTKKIHTKPEVLHSLKTKPIAPPPDVRFVKTDHRITGGKSSKTQTIFESPSSQQQQLQKAHYEEDAIYHSDEEIEDKPTEENFRRNQGSAPQFADTTQRLGHSTQAAEARGQTTQEGFKSQQRVRFSEQDEDYDTRRVQISYAQPQPHHNEPQPQRMQVTREEHPTHVMDNYLDRGILRDIREEIVRINQRATDEDDEPLKTVYHADKQKEQFNSDFADENPLQTIYTGVKQEAQPHPGYFGQKFDLRPSAVLPYTGSSDELHRRLGLESTEREAEIDQEQLVKRMAKSALNEKLKDILAEERRKDEQVKENIFKPVETVSTQEVITAKQKQEAHIREQPAPEESGRTVLNSTEISNLLAENMLNLFSNAMQHINTSLVRNITLTKTLIPEENSKASILELFGRKREPAVDIASDKKSKVIIEEEKPESGLRESHTFMDKLSLESRRTLEERELMKLQKPVNVEYFAERPQQKLNSPGFDNFYFMQHEPKPITDYSDYCRDLESEASSVGIRSGGRLSRQGWDTGSEMAYRSEGYSGIEGQSDYDM